MTILEALRRGVAALNGRKRLWFLFYAVTTFWAIAMVAPVMTILFGSLGQSAWAERMTGGFDLEWLGEMLTSPSALAVAPLVAAAIAVFAVAAVAHLFLLGGAIELFCAREAFSMAAYFRGCGKNFWRFVRLALVSALFYAVVGLINAGLAAAGNKIWGEGSEQTPLIHRAWFRVAVVLALFGLVNLVFDYARIRLAALDSKKAWRGAMAAWRFVFSNFGRTAGLYIAVWIVMLAIVAIYRGVAGLLEAPTAGIVLLLLLVRQVTVLARIWTQLLFYSSGAEMWLALAPPAVEAAPAVVEIAATADAEPAAPIAPVPEAEPADLSGAEPGQPA